MSDINEHMLNEAKIRSEQHDIGNVEVDFQIINAEDLSNFEDDSLDGYSIAFGIRNVTHIEKALKEANRVLKKGGRFVCLEFCPDALSEIPFGNQFYNI